MNYLSASIYVLILIFLISAPAQAEGWTGYSGDTQNTAHTSSAVPARNVTLGWSYPMNGSASSPAVADGTVYVGGFGSNYWRSVPSLDEEDRDVQGYIYALNSSTGTLEWRSPTNESVWSSPAYARGTVYIGDLSGVMYAVDGSSGEVVWSFESGDPIFASPTVSDGSVYYGTRGYDAHELSEGEDFFLYSLDSSDGGVNWRKGMDQGVYGSPAVVNGTVYVGDQNGTVYAIDGSSGATEWKFEIRGDERAEDPAKRFGVVNSPAVKNGVVYAVSYNGVVYALKSRTGEEIWNTSTGGLVASSPAVDGQSVYLGNYDGEVYSISRSTGRIEWHRKVSDGRISKSSPAVAGDTVVIGGLDGYLHGLGSETGERRWSYEASSPILSSPAVVNGSVYFSDSNGVYVVAGMGVEIGSLTAEIGVSEESSGTEDVDENRTENNTLIDSFLSLLEKIFS